jgi:hypothetical protein
MWESGGGQRAVDLRSVGINVTISRIVEVNTRGNYIRLQKVMFRYVRIYENNSLQTTEWNCVRRTEITI